MGQADLDVILKKNNIAKRFQLVGVTSSKGRIKTSV